METTVGEAIEAIAQALRGAGVPEEVAERTAWLVVVAEVQGRRSHGLLRVPHYLERLRRGGANPSARLVVVSDTGPSVALDGEDGLGHHQLWEAATLATARAADHGLAAVSVGNSGHCGALGLYTCPAVEAGCVALVFSNGPAVMPPHGGSQPVVSTSPIAAGFPTAPPAVIDLATSVVARGRIAEAAGRNAPLEEGWAFDSAGTPTTDPVLALEGMLAPIGGAKGFALAFLVEALTGAMVGTSLAVDVADPLDDADAERAQRIGHLVVVLDPRCFDVEGGEGAERRMARLARLVEAAGGRVPGVARRWPSDIRHDERIVVDDALAAALFSS